MTYYTIIILCHLSYNQTQLKIIFIRPLSIGIIVHQQNYLFALFAFRFDLYVFIYYTPKYIMTFKY